MTDIHKLKGQVKESPPPCPQLPEIPKENREKVSKSFEESRKHFNLTGRYVCGEQCECKKIN